ncbi:hypothetical protein EON65_47505 [archaeon]|nr:MAG: hypothetical protein EON65_47505 [archaeon]
MHAFICPIPLSIIHTHTHTHTHTPSPGMVMHSSPIEIYESPNCRGQYVEEMSSDECAQCMMEITTYTFVKVPDLLAWAQNKVCDMSFLYGCMY